MPTIHIMVRQRRAESPVSHIVCGNKDYTVRFDFDAEWDAYDMKTARFAWNGQQEDVVFTGDTCAVPQINNAQVCAVGVFAGDLCTTTPALVHCDKSILCMGGAPADPSPDVYAQLMEGFNTGKFGGYYTPTVEQISEDKVRITLTPSGEAIPALPPTEVVLHRGPKGEPFTYDDFTSEQLGNIVQSIVSDVMTSANICYVSAAAPTSDVGKDGDIFVVTG